MVLGRNGEREQLKKAFRSNSSEFIAIYGRRRVGKTYLVRNVYEKEILFELTGVHNAPLKLRLQNFSQSLFRYTGNISTTSENWMETSSIL